MTYRLISPISEREYPWRSTKTPAEQSEAEQGEREEKREGQL